MHYALYSKELIWRVSIFFFFLKTLLIFYNILQYSDYDMHEYFYRSNNLIRPFHWIYTAFLGARMESINLIESTQLDTLHFRPENSGIYS
jgi:hypothetical protein